MTLLSNRLYNMSFSHLYQWCRGTKSKWYTVCLYVCHYFPPLFLQRLNEARRMMDKLRACIVANYYANAGITKLPEVHSCIFIPRQLSAQRHQPIHFFCLPARLQERPCRAEPSCHQAVLGVPVPVHFPSQPGLWDPVPGSLGVRVPVSARRGSWAGRGGGMEGGRQQAGAQTGAQHRKGEFKWQRWWGGPYLVNAKWRYSCTFFLSFMEPVMFSIVFFRRTHLACHCP